MTTKVESDYKTRIDNQVNIHVRNLISSMTDFDETDENFGIAFEYIVSNLRNHRFLSVDKFRVKRELGGLEEKLEINLLLSEAEQLRSLVNKFMERRLKPHVPDIHFSILQFLLLISNNPIPFHLENQSAEKKHQEEQQRIQNIYQSTTRMIDENQMINDNINSIRREQEEIQRKYDQELEFESSSEDDDQEEEDEEMNEDLYQEASESEESDHTNQQERNTDKNNIVRQGYSMFKVDKQSLKKEGIMKNKLNQNSTIIGDRSMDQSKIVSFKNINNNSSVHHKKDSMLSVTNPHQMNGDDSLKNINNNGYSGFLGGIQTNQSFWNTTQQSMMKKSTLQRRTYEEFLTEQKQDEERKLFLSTRNFTKNDLFKDPNSLAQIYENYVKETINRDQMNQPNNNQQSQLQLNHWIYQNKTERQIIQDIVQMLQSQPSETFVLVGESPPVFKLKKKIQVSHLTPSTLENMIDQCIDFANQLLKFQYYRIEYSSIEIGTTFQAFLASIQAFHLQFQKYINAFHLVFLYQSAQIQKKEIEITLEEKYKYMLQKTITLMELLRGLRDYQMEMKMMMNMLEGVIEIFQKSSNGSIRYNKENVDSGMTDPSNDQNNVQGYIACQIIDFLYFQLKIDSQYYCTSSALQQLNSQLFLFSIEPYLEILNEWLHGGFFFDKFSEFFIKNNTRNQNQQHVQQKYQHIDHKINWVKDFSLRFHQEFGQISKTATPNFLKKYEQKILQIGKNIRLIGYILNEHQQRIIVREKLKIEDIREQIKNQISDAIHKISLSQVSTRDNTSIQQSTQTGSINKIEQLNAPVLNKSEFPGNNNSQNPKRFLKNISISNILKQKSQPMSSIKEKTTFQMKDDINLDDKSLHQSVIMNESAMQVESENKVKDNPFNIFAVNQSEIFNQSVFSLQDSFLHKIIPDLEKLNIKTNQAKSTEQVSLNKKINQMIEKEGFTSQFLRLFDLSIEHTITSMDNQVKQYLGSILLNDFKLLDHFKALRHIYFMENGHITTDFLSYLFDNLQIYDTIKNASSIKNYFKELVTHSNQPCIKNLSEHFSVEINSDQENAYLKNLKIMFEAPYPLDAIFDSDAIFLYNHIFQFLVQLKKASHFLLEKNYYLKKMRFFDNQELRNKISFFNKEKSKPKKKQNDYSDSEDDDSRFDQMDVEYDKEEQIILNKQIKSIKWKMCLLQKQLLNFINSFQYSTFVAIIEELTREFLEDIQKEFNITLFIDKHKQYLKKIADLCFLSKKSENIFSIINSLLQYCCDFHALIQRLEATQTLDQYTMKGELQRIQRDFTSLQNNFNRYNLFVINFLHNYEDKGLKQEWVPLNQCLDYNNFYVKEDDLKKMQAKNN